MLEKVFEVSKVVPARTRYEVLSKLMEEVGELAQEIGIAEGYQKREPGKDGIIGEVIDIINTSLDILWLTDPEIDKEEVMKVLDDKLLKWKTQVMPKENI